MSDHEQYYRFTSRQRLDKACHELEGILKGIAADDFVSDEELSFLNKWLRENLEFSNAHPFCELIPLVNHMVMGHRIEDEDREDLLWLCKRLTSENEFFDFVTSDIQRLQGVVSGIISDGKITEDELRSLQTWLDDHKSLRTCWPYDEVDAVVTAVMQDGVIDEREHEFLMHFFSDFATGTGKKSLENPLMESGGLISGVCAVCPEIEFSNMGFCFTGQSDRASRQKIMEVVAKLSGIPKTSVTSKTDYLIIGSGGNPCWAFSCYGRKVEIAVDLRKNGHSILIVHEYDFWDAVDDHQH